MIRNKYKVKKTVKCQDCRDKELKLSINRFRCDACRCILCREHFKQGLIYGSKYYNDIKYCMCNLCNYMYNR